MEINEIQKLRKAKGWSKRKLALKAGISPAYVGLLEKGMRPNLSVKIMNKLERALGVNRENNTKELLHLDFQKVKIVGIVPAGIPASNEQQDLGYIYVESKKLGGVKMGDVYALKVSGNSLAGDGIEDGGTVIIEPNAEIIDGKIYIIRLGNETFARHLFRKNGIVVLTSSNGAYQELKLKEVEILGRVIMSFGPEKKH